MIKQFSQRILVLAIAMSIHFFYGQEKIPNSNLQTGFGQLNFLPVTMPNNEVNMNLSGVHYNVNLNNWSYLGLGFYGAIGGIRGGLFTLGINVGTQFNITKKLFIDSGIHFGGGGGASAPDGGGAFILPHINLGYDFKHFSLTTGYSYINFFDQGNISSHQINAGIQIPLSFDTSNFDHNNKKFRINELEASSWNKSSNRLSLMMHLNNLKVNKGSYEGQTIRLAGFELNSYFNNSLFFFLKADGAYHGIKAGYMDILLGAGYHLSMNRNNTNILAKFGVGAGGGGGVDTQGGVLIYPDLSIEQRVFDNIYLSLNKGYLMSPNSHFVTSSYGLGVKYYIDKDGIQSNGNSFTNGKFKGIETTIKQELYFKAQRDQGSGQNMQQISMQINFFLNKYFYAAGETSFANFGGAGAYAEGIVGLGVRSKPIFNSTTAVFTQFLGGAAGGGGISTGQGLIIKPSIGIDFKISEKLGLKGAVGYVGSRGGKLNTTFLNLGLSYRFSFLSMKK